MESLPKVVSVASLPLKLSRGVALSHAVVTLQALSGNNQPSPALWRSLGAGSGTQGSCGSSRSGSCVVSCPDSKATGAYLLQHEPDRIWEH